MAVFPARQRIRVSVEAFDSFVNLPENAEISFEYIGGELIEAPSNAYVSKIATRVYDLISLYQPADNLGHLTDESASYIVSGERYRPDVAFISHDKQPELALDGFNPAPPDLAVEVEFPGSHESQRDLRIKTANYLAAGTTVWVIYPTDDLKDQRVEIYRPGQPVEILRTGDNAVIGGDAFLPGLEIALKDIFQS